MNAQPPPNFDDRKRRQLGEELASRARLWLPDWQPDADTPDAMSAFLKIAATLSAEVTQRLNRVPEKSFRGLLHWFGKRGKAGHAARMPVVFKMSERTEPLLATAPVQLQADAAGTPVIFETEETIRLVASKLQAVVATRTDKNRFYEAFPGLDNLVPPDPAPDVWQLRTPAPFGSTQVQLNPPEGLSVDVILCDDKGNKYKIKTAKDGLVTLSHGLGLVELPEEPAPLPAGLYNGEFRRINAFSPFDGKERNQQEHALYLGAETGLDIQTASVIELVGDLPKACNWSYWGKAPGESESDWQDLKQEFPAFPNVLSKGKGEIEKREIDGANLRWLRAMPADPETVKQQFANEIRFKINCLHGDKEFDDKLKGLLGPPESKRPTIALEAVANTTPVVLDQGFYPFGREPRQFDAFYLSCPEAFGKPNAFATVTVKLGDGFAGPLNSIGHNDGYSLVAGIGNDQKLWIVYVNTKDGEAVVNFLPTAHPKNAIGRPVAFITQKVGAAFEGVEAGPCYFSATDGHEVWLWKSDFSLSEFKDPNSDAPDPWHPCGAPAASPNGPISETCLLRDRGGRIKVYALVNGEIYWRHVLDPGGWIKLPVVINDVAQKIARLIPFENLALPAGAGSDDLGLAAVTSEGKLVYCQEVDGVWTAVNGLDTTLTHYPMALWYNEKRLIYARSVQKDAGGSETSYLKAFAIEGGKPTLKTTLWSETLIGDGYSFAWRKGMGEPVVIFACSSKDRSPSIGMWQPFSAAEPVIADEPLPPLPIEQAPVRLPNGYLLPLQHGAVAPTKFTEMPFVQNTTSVSKLTSIVMPEEAPTDGESILLILHLSGKKELFYPKTIDKIGFELPSLHPQAHDSIKGEIYALARPRRGAVRSEHEFELDKDDNGTDKGTVLSIALSGSGDTQPMQSLATVIDVKDENHANKPKRRMATVDIDLPEKPIWRTYFVLPESTGEQELTIRPTQLVKGHIEKPSRHEGIIVEFGEPKSAVRASLFDLPTKDDANDRIILADVWVGSHVPESGTPVRFILQPQAGLAVSPPTARNPQLSWEYWNGSSWWQILGLTDNTNDLVLSGGITFCVPTDLRPSEVAGRAGSWIRARLTGGDYGQETVRLKTPKDDKETQIVIRDPSSIRAPYIVGLNVNYELCCAIAPDRIVTLDNGAYRDQTEINLTPNARIAVFTPLATALSIAGIDDNEAGTDKPDCCQDCADHANREVKPNADAKSPPFDKAIYLGFTEKLQGSSITILFLVNETAQYSELPLEVAAFANGEFRKIAVKDDTRALTESGIVTLSCPEPLQTVSFFGHSLHWLRLTPPEGSDATNWNPKIRRIYLNSVWANAGETRREEIVGLSDGSPDQVFSLAHTPILDNTLELRIREPIGDEEKEDLLNAGPDNVKDMIGLWPGPWVRWYPGELATARNTGRVFDFDASLGAITFGNGREGAIPPIGSNNIVAVTYRSGGATAANNVTAWSQINLISPLRGVEETVTPEGAAGGNDPQDVATALRFVSSNIAMRDRAVTLQDFERHALQFSPDIAQVKAYLKGEGIALVVVMRGRNPVPSNSVRRELVRWLRDKASPALRHSGALNISPPQPVLVDISLLLAVIDLAAAGTVAEAVDRRVRALLDAGSGDFDGMGWRLGAMPTTTHIAATISDIPGIAETVSISIDLREGLHPPLGLTQLVMLADSGTSVSCVQAIVEGA